MLVVHVYGPTSMRVDDEEPLVWGLAVVAALPVATAVVTVPTLSVAVVETDGMLSDDVVDCEPATDNDLLSDDDASLSAQRLSEPVARLAKDVCEVRLVALAVPLDGEAVLPSWTGHILHTRRVTSQ